MKNAKAVLMLLIAGTLLVSSCKKEETPTPTPPPPAPTAVSFKATIDGVVTTFTGSYFQAISGGHYIQGGGTTQPYIQIMIPFSQSTGTFTMDGMSALANYRDSGGTDHQSDSGTVTISSVASDKISGTFSFSETGGVTITNGTFSNIPKL